MLQRKEFIQQILFSAGIGLSGLPLITSLHSGTTKSLINPGDIILFQGDSITDAGRNRESTVSNSSSGLGNGYTYLASAELLCAHPDWNLQIYNRGISGHKIPELADRWQEDCVDLKPNVLSILIGVNDYWHKLNHGYQGTSLTFLNQYKQLIDKTLESLPEVKLIIGEPFAMTGIKAVDESWFPEFNEYRAGAHSIAKAYNARWIPYQSIFEEASEKAPSSYWTYDGVHTTLAGSQLMAEAWLLGTR